MQQFSAQSGPKQKNRKEQDRLEANGGWYAEAAHQAEMAVAAKRQRKWADKAAVKEQHWRDAQEEKILKIPANERNEKEAHEASQARAAVNTQDREAGGMASRCGGHRGSYLAEGERDA
jgi:hypothetical protein